MSKGSGRRPAAISSVEAERNWARTFGKGAQLAGKAPPSDSSAETIPRVLNGGVVPQNGFYRDHRNRGWAVDFGGQPISATEGA